LPAPALNVVLKSNGMFEIAFADNLNWRENIFRIRNKTENRIIAESDIDTTQAGKIMMNQSNYVYEPGRYEFVISATGYQDVTVEIDVAPPVAPPALTGTVVSEHEFHITFSDDPSWREHITKVWDRSNERWIDGFLLDTTQPGKVIMNVQGRNYAPGTYEFAITVDGYTNAIVEFEVIERR
jgi:hypothetical protein